MVLNPIGIRTKHIALEFQNWQYIQIAEKI